MTNFDQLAESRRQWIAETLEPWCQQACRKDLRRAELEWLDIAGKVDVNATLWTWAWSRFPALVEDRIAGVNETLPVTVTLEDQSQHTGYPDSRESEHGHLVLVSRTDDGQTITHGPFSIDDITSVEQADL